MSCSFQSAGDRNTTGRPRFNNINDVLGRGHDEKEKKKSKKKNFIKYINASSYIIVIRFRARRYFSLVRRRARYVCACSLQNIICTRE